MQLATETEADQFNINVIRSNGWGELKLGFKYDDRESDGGGAALSIVNNGILPIPVEAWFDQPWPTDFKNTIGGYSANNLSFAELWKPMERDAHRSLMMN